MAKIRGQNKAQIRSNFEYKQIIKYNIGKYIENKNRIN